ncbi:hypothetical protein HYN49_11820 [Flavobacterium pallidum]|uniref:T9SS C-terminal target domain-containing protein n=1 Tax=Flavobacterium pallidum TaxID=2172098 RepID=A0A2S1SLP9_9FLAO|nr:hypothetical protein HYN49_11820 [Flavobacterium pallidum]
MDVIFEFPKEIKEASALQYVPETDLFWTLEDSGNDPVLFALDKKGKLQQTVHIHKSNHDWEALTSDGEGNLYIGDFGNNDNDRKDLAIYKINAADLSSNEAGVSAEINFYFPEQKDFPPKKSMRIFDAEAFFLYNNNFYIFTKNRSTDSDGTTQLYSVPNIAGNHAAKLLGSFKTGREFRKSAVTDAAINADGTRMALLSNQKIWLFENFKNDAYFNGKVTEISLNDNSQKEGLCFKENDLFICDEKDKHTGGKMYQLNLK